MGLFVSIKRTRGQTPLANPNDMDFVLRFFFIVLTNIMCWAPVYVLRLLVLLKYPVPGYCVHQSFAFEILIQVLNEWAFVAQLKLYNLLIYYFFFSN